MKRAICFLRQGQTKDIDNIVEEMKEYCNMRGIEYVDNIVIKSSELDLLGDRSEKFINDLQSRGIDTILTNNDLPIYAFNACQGSLLESLNSKGMEWLDIRYDFPVEIYAKIVAAAIEDFLEKAFIPVLIIHEFENFKKEKDFIKIKTFMNDILNVTDYYTLSLNDKDSELQSYILDNILEHMPKYIIVAKDHASTEIGNVLDQLGELSEYYRIIYLDEIDMMLREFNNVAEVNSLLNR